MSSFTASFRRVSVVNVMMRIAYFVVQAIIGFIIGWLIGSLVDFVIKIIRS